ncbi:DUF445 domain-containing protein [Leptolyngbya ohadii]|uniref:DUF445 domain-containing protein n=1 Tax=Leptolyngbya ohadii TaxID=1962290 RepID=UPI001CEDD7D8|nr:DUF445 family protein [Leptolyngbya ohadii]
MIGYFTNDLAIKMLFRPYKAIYLGGRKLPFTPGLIPSNQERMAKRVSDTIMGSLLTPEELQNLARKLLETERIQAAIEWLLNLALDQVQGRNQEKAASVVANILHDLVGQSLPRVIKVLARREDFLEAQLNQLFDQVLLELRLTEPQAEQVADWILQSVIPPDVLRQIIVDFLTDRNIKVIDEGFRERTSGTYWVVANLFGVRNALTRLRTYCLDERESTNVRLDELIQSLGIRDRFKELLQNLSLQNLPVTTVRQLRKTMRDEIRLYLQDKGSDLLQDMSDSIDWNEVANLLLNRLRTSEAVASSLHPISYELALVLERYLEKDLESLVAQAIPILNIDQVIINRVKATSPADLEGAIQGIVKSELQAIVNLGGILGFVIGLLQVGLLLMR